MTEHAEDTPVPPAEDITEPALDDPGAPGPQAGTGMPPDAGLVERLRRENASWRLKVRDLESRHRDAEALVTTIARVLGLDTGDPAAPEAAEAAAAGAPAEEPPAPGLVTLALLDDVLARVTAQRAELRALKVERALGAAAERHGADPDLVVPVLAHTGGLDGLDPDADGFPAALDELVKNAVEGNPKLRATQVAPRGGAEFPGRSAARSTVAPGMDRLRHAYANLTT